MRAAPLLALPLAVWSAPSVVQDRAQDVAQDWPGTGRLGPLVEAHGLSSDLDALVRKMADLSGATRAERIAPVFRAFAGEPLRGPAVALETTDALAAAAREADLAGLLAEAARLRGIDLPGPLDFRALFPRKAGFLARMDQTVELLEAAAAEVEQAFAALEPERRHALRGALGALFDELRTNVYVHDKPAHVLTWELAGKVDLAALLRAAALLAPLAEPRFAEELRAAYREERPERPGTIEGVQGNLLYARATELGWVLVGSAADNVYALPVAFLFDLAGDDRYSALTTSSDLDAPVNVVIDHEGADRYEDEGDLGQGCGVMGVSLLVDHAGRDRYSGRRHVQGSGVLGVGVLVDMDGDDEYAADAYAQGAGAFGVGVLLDAKGDDVLESHLYSQGFGAPLSVGLLLDVEGDDARTCRGVYPSAYGTEGEFSAFSQGCGLGFRTLDWTTTKAAGGVGVLLDGGGNDVSTVGEFGYGIGYFFGVGIARDLAGDDEVHASRYGIATGAHFGVGVVLDDAGNDRYRCPYTAAIAGNWDLSLSWFLDREGDDEYEAAGISLGCGTITSFACFVDGGGEDRYGSGGASCFGNSGHAQDLDRESRSLALFLDLGGGRDAYSSTGLDPAPANGLETVRRRTDVRETEGGAISRESGVGVFLDE